MWITYTLSKSIVQEIYNAFSKKRHQHYLKVFQKRAAFRLQRWWRKILKIRLNTCKNQQPLKRVKFDADDEDGPVFKRLGKVMRNSLVVSSIYIGENKERIA